MHPIIKYSLYGTVALMFGLLVVTEFFMLFPFRTVDMKQPYHIITQNLHAGDEIQYLLDYCKYTTKRANTVRILVGEDGSRYLIAAAPTAIVKGCGKVISTAKLPLDMVSQNYVIKVTNTYDFPFGRQVEKNFESEMFFVKPVIIPVVKP